MQPKFQSNDMYNARPKHYYVTYPLPKCSSPQVLDQPESFNTSEVSAYILFQAKGDTLYLHHKVAGPAPSKWNDKRL